MSEPEKILRMEGISKAFPGVQALHDVDFDVAEGEVVALVGENGAGKSTLMKVLCGAHKRDTGRILLHGKPVEIGSPLAAQKLGIAIIYQEFNLTPNQTVAANIFVAREPMLPRLGGILHMVDRRRMEREAQVQLDRVGARVRPTALIRSLSVAQQQMVEVAKALAVDARIIVMDEPTSALGEDEAETLFGIIDTLKRNGIAVVFITHRLEEVLRISDRVVVLRDGRLIGSIPTAKATSESIIQMMVGRQLVEEMFHKEEAEIGAPLMEVEGLSARGVVKDVGFTLRRGEILGVAGLVGAGRTETARLLFGADRKDAGQIRIDGQHVDIESPEDAVRAGMGLVPEDRGAQGLILKLPVLENIVLPSLDELSRFKWVLRTALVETAQTFVAKLNIRTPHLRQKAMFLSGGNQQKVVLAKWLAMRPKILILDEPTRGIDVAAKAEVHALMSRLAREGMGIMMISSELPEIMGMSDRILVMHEGRVAGVLDRAEATQEKIMAYASGETGNNGAASAMKGAAA